LAGADRGERAGHDVQHLRCRRAEEEPPRLGEAAGAHDGEFAGLPAELGHRVFDAVASSDHDIGVDAVGEFCECLRQHVIGVGGAGDPDDARVDARRQIDRDERQQPKLGTGGCRQRGALLQQGIGPRAGADRRRDACDAGGRIDPPRAFRGEHHRQLRGVEQFARDRAEPVTAAESAVRGADDDVRGAELGGRVGKSFREGVAVADVGAHGDSIPRLQSRLSEPLLRLVLDVLVVAGIRRCDHASAVGRQHHDDVEFPIGCRGEPGAEGHRIRSGVRGRIADDDMSAHARASSMMFRATSRPMRIAPSTC
jgi:hypothetical protein